MMLARSVEWDPVCWVCGKTIPLTDDWMLVRWTDGMPEYAHTACVP